MVDETKRYRVRPKTFLCLTPQEALASGITIGEETVEELMLAVNPRSATSQYAALLRAGDEVLRAMPVDERQETLFEDRSEAAEFIREHGPDRYQLYRVTNVRTVDRGEIKDETQEQPIEDIIDQLKSFEIK